MPVDFATWLGRMANSIEDTSYIKKENCTHTKMQIRAMFADLMVPRVITLEDALGWMDVFCITYDVRSESIDQLSKYDLLGTDKAEEYYNCADENTADWVNAFRRLVRQGWQPPESQVWFTL